MDPFDWEFIFGDEIRKYVDQNGVDHIEEFIGNRLEGWQEVDVNIAVTGDSGTGKSSFINTIRG